MWFGAEKNIIRHEKQMWLGTENEEFEMIDYNKNILILVDVQVGFTKKFTVEKIPVIEKLLEARLFDTVVATKYWNTPDSNISRLMDWKDLCTEEEQALVPEIIPYVDYITEKNIYSGVTEELVELLTKLGKGELPPHVFLLGFDTECCLLSTAADLFELGVRPLVLTEYSGSHDGPKYHNAGIISMEHLIGPDFLITDSDIRSREDVADILKRAYVNQNL